ncbi:c-type cytochrome [Marinobacter sp. JSM 1782161]|uniref:c-type cytochrome n=1 Tax=Marinobacter sp. JSM 1782161 TaxID=2685906 RepID=UPI001403680B|nr:cytochrome c [Marinobacter sp. JSM 1782161]
MAPRPALLALLMALASPALAGEAGTGGAWTPKQNYTLRCIGCHGPHGAGSERGRIPDFRDSVASFSYLPRGREYLLHVPGVVGSSLNDQQIADVLNYVMKEWGGESLGRGFTPFTDAEVHYLRQTDVQDVVQLRREVARQLKAEGRPVADYPWP